MDNKDYFEETINIVNQNSDHKKEVKQKLRETIDNARKLSDSEAHAKSIADQMNYVEISEQNIVLKRIVEMDESVKVKIRDAIKKGLAIIMSAAIIAGAIKLESKQIESTNELMDDYGNFIHYTSELNIEPTEEAYDYFMKYIQPTLSDDYTIDDLINAESSINEGGKTLE